MVLATILAALLALGPATPVEVVEIEIHTTPPGARVFLDGELLGKTPYINRRSPYPRKLSYRLRLRGYCEAVIETEALRSSRHEVRLTKRSSAKCR